MQLVFFLLFFLQYPTKKKSKKLEIKKLFFLMSNSNLTFLNLCIILYFRCSQIYCGFFLCYIIFLCCLVVIKMTSWMYICWCKKKKKIFFLLLCWKWNLRQQHSNCAFRLWSTTKFSGFFSKNFPKPLIAWKIYFQIF